MTRILPPAVALAAVVLLGAWTSRSAAAPRPGAAGEAGARPAPEFPTQDPVLWINSAPLSMSDQRGRVVLIDVFTYG